jgi:hypothetical protein
MPPVRGTSLRSVDLDPDPGAPLGSAGPAAPKRAPASWRKEGLGVGWRLRMRHPRRGAPSVVSRSPFIVGWPKGIGRLLDEGLHQTSMSACCRGLELEQRLKRRWQGASSLWVVRCSPKGCRWWTHDRSLSDLPGRAQARSACAPAPGAPCGSASRPCRGLMVKVHALRVGGAPLVSSLPALAGARRLHCGQIAP